MARPILKDYLQVFSFWLFDIKSEVPGEEHVLDPQLGFQSISMPEINLEPQTITEGNWYFEKFVVKSATIGQVSLQRGLQYKDTDFYKWATAALTGNKINAVGGHTPRRNFVLVHYFAKDVSGPSTTPWTNAPAQDGWNRVPAKAFLLKGCLPVRYKAGSDFAANDSAISVAELDMQLEGFEEISLGTIPAAPELTFLQKAQNVLREVESKAAEANTAINQVRGMVVGAQSYIQKAKNRALYATKVEQDIISVVTNATDLVGKTPERAANDAVAAAKAIASSQAAANDSAQKAVVDAAKSFLKRTKLG